jgi:hypothetical protein
MILPELIHINDYPANQYLDVIYDIFKTDVVEGNLNFLQLPIQCPWHPPYDNKHFSFWHLISEKDSTAKEENRTPCLRRCERIKWIAYVIKNACDKNMIWCWEKDIQTSRGRNTHIHLYLHQERYLIVLRKKSQRLELVTTFVVHKNNHAKKEKEAKNYLDPRLR